jgi:hypothetical protein
VPELRADRQQHWSRGFKLHRTFELGTGGVALTVDIDLLKSLHEELNGYLLRPTARMQNTAEFGTIAGRVDQAFNRVLSRYDGTTLERLRGLRVRLVVGEIAAADLLGPRRAPSRLPALRSGDLLYRGEEALLGVPVRRAQHTLSDRYTRYIAKPCSRLGDVELAMVGEKTDTASM